MLTARFTRKQMTVGVCFALALITAALYAPILGHGFLTYDDPDYITGNTHVRAGLTWSGIVWAFQSDQAGNWHPLTWISHELDCQLFGLHPAGHHLMNLLLHTANAVLLFLWLKRLTGALWRSAFVAALFAWHPLHVESVAWVSERKDVLSAFFWMLTLIAYTRFVEASRGQSPKRKVFYALALFLFACGLMSKPMVVTLPFVLLLLDFWPLGRLAIESWRFTLWRLVWEKAPFFALTVVSCVITFIVQRGAQSSVIGLPLSERAANVALAYVRYLSKIFWPTDLALIYPYPQHWPLVAVVAAVLALVLVSAIFILQAKQFPYLAVGWLWFLGTLVPVIGLVQVGVQSIADRYTYLPSIGVFILVAWGVNDLLNSRPQKAKIAALAGGAALAGCLAITAIQLNYWRNSIALFWHAIQVTTDNYPAMDCLGAALDDAGQTDAALQMFTNCLRIKPDYAMGQFDLGMALLEKGRAAEASNHLAAAVRLWPRQPVMQFDFGTYLFLHGQPDAAIRHFQAALAVQPDFAEAHNGLGKALLAQGRTNAAVAQFAEAIRLKPDYAEARQNLAKASGQPAK